MASQTLDRITNDGPFPKKLISSCNLVVIDKLAPDHLIVSIQPPIHNWWCGQFDVPTDREVTIGFSLDENNPEEYQPNVEHLVGLKPLMTYADPGKYESYEWFK